MDIGALGDLLAHDTGPDTVRERRAKEKEEREKEERMRTAAARGASARARARAPPPPSSSPSSSASSVVSSGGARGVWGVSCEIESSEASGVVQSSSAIKPLASRETVWPVPEARVFPIRGRWC